WKYSSDALRLLVDAGRPNAARQYHRDLTAGNSPWSFTDDKRAQLNAIINRPPQPPPNRLRALPDMTGPLPFLHLGAYVGESKRTVLLAAAPGPKGGVTRGTWTPKGELIEVKHIPAADRLVVCTFRDGRFLLTFMADGDAWAPPRWKPGRI